MELANPHSLLGHVKADSLSKAEEAFKPLAQMKIAELKKAAKMHTVVLKYPGKSAQEMFASDDVLQTRQAIKPVMLYPSLNK